MDIICKFCNKKYASYSSRSNHIKKFHNSDNNGNIIKPLKFTEIKQLNDKYYCQICKEKFNNINDLDCHIKLKCKSNIRHDNVFKFNTNTFGKNKYPNDNGGDIYIIQTDFSLKGYYKIGITTNLYHRMANYRCGSVIEPRIHCYFPIKDIKQSDSLMKKKLSIYNIKREIYKIDNLMDITKILKELQKEMESEELEVLPEIRKCDISICNYCKNLFTCSYELNIHLETCEEYKKESSINNKHICKNCNKGFKYKQGKWKHEQKCKQTYKQEFETIKKLVYELKEKLDQLNIYKTKQFCNSKSISDKEIIV